MAEAELPIVLDPASRVPLAAQLAARLRGSILDGTLRAEDTLPSSRRLADQLGVSRGVVVRAFEQLAGEGYLDAQGAGGTRVAVRPDLGGAREPSPGPRPAEQQAPVIDLSPGRPSAAAFRNPEWRAAWRMAVAESDWSSLPPPLGTPAFRAAIAKHLATSRGVAADPDDVIVTAGTSDALQLVVAALRRRSPAPRVLVEDPGYPTGRRVLAASGAAVETIPVGPDGATVSGLRALPAPPDAILVTPSHQYPLGGRMPVSERLGLLAWAAEHGVLVLEDDYDSEFRHTRMPLPAVASLPSVADVVLIGTFSKVLSPWLRCGYLVVRGEPGEWLKETRRALDTPVSGTMQAALALFLEGGGLARHVMRARREYAHRRGLLLERLGRRDDVELSAVDGGLHAVLRLADGVSAAGVAEEALQAGVQVALLAAYHAGWAPAGLASVGLGVIGSASVGSASAGAAYVGSASAGAAYVGSASARGAYIGSASARGAFVDPASVGGAFVDPAAIGSASVGSGAANGLVIGYGAPTDLELARALDILAGILDRRR
ncbi:aminotransferase class I/II-fold pyridoxal phosphate-dependent enzyme [Sinomonas sp. ASV322]|uniref:MocR-like pyridoxine biosynthesis transcription factor PdxR n=1 Tax=Sinomonas sp. ASV322 TaxID=3041920 RepID=UPI0027DC0E48|nr:aminotransferase class I/II-fold pyridoxal phosphate-dependent enzyme [Sinomonas sp. ASV322]MDQ4504527.1 aminotransferase class I/II-fold pyridoxal phosphate-dependent enzyme [Sinomonas sp. ASV322]